MYADNTLTPKEAIRLCALGTLTQSPMLYGPLANSIRHFVSHILGPSLDVLGPSLELLKYEGLVSESTPESDKDIGSVTYTITEEGLAEFNTLMTANIRTAAAELNKLVVTLKFRFLHLLSTEDQRIQTGLLIEFWENEISRLISLRQHHENDEGALDHWLGHEIELLETRLTWLEEFSENL